MKSKTAIPRRRFNGFTEGWEQRKLYDLLELLTDYDANGSFADMANNVNTYEGEGFAWYVRMTDLVNQSPLSELKYVDESSYKFLKKTELHGGELLMAKRGEIGNVYLFKARTERATLAPNMYLLKLNNQTVPDYMYGFFQAEIGKRQLLRLNASTTMGALYKDDVKSIDVIVPNLEEQKMIAGVFNHLDNLIALHESKVAKLNCLKKAYLSELFPRPGEKVPRRRFVGFTGDWEQRKLGDIAKRVQGNDGRMDLPTLTISAANGWMNQIERFSGNIAGKEQKNYTLLHKGELSYNHGNSKLAKYGTVFSLRSHEEALVPRVYHSFKMTDGNADFIEYYFATRLLDRELAKLISSGARMDGLLNISFDEFMGIKFNVPSLEEQSKISDYMRKLDDLIALHQRKLKKLQALKKAYLAEMFV